jgi:AAA15 family ATPase/GTPase
MLLTFSVTNFKGIRDKQTFDLVATPKNEFPETLFEIDERVRVNKSAVIIGANSSGKTHLLEAIKVFSIDEYDGPLHNKLSVGILDLIKDTENTLPNQMIMTTHDILLLDHQFRRDSIFILSKDENLSTVINKASDYSVRKDAKLSLKYLNNEFGSLPNILSMNDE